MKKILVLILIIYSNSLFVFAQDSDSKIKTEFARNNISISMSDVVFKRISFQYERIIGENGKLSLTVPFSYSFGNHVQSMSNDIYYVNVTPYMFDYFDDYSDYYIGLGFNLYPTGQGVFRMYFGPEFRMGPAHYTIDYQYYNYLEGDYISTDVYQQKEEFKYFQTAFLMNFGAIYEPSKNLIISLNLGVGYLNRDDEKSTRALISPNFRIGYRF